MGDTIKRIFHFLSYEIWRITDNDVSKHRSYIYYVLKTIIITIRRFKLDRITDKASALTYSTILSIVPILAIIFAIGKGFGFSDLIEKQLRTTFAGQEETIDTLLEFVNSYLSQTKSGLFVGIGIVLLLWTIINLISNVELQFNHIWQIKKSRGIYRKFTDYFSVILLMPFFILFSGGLSIYLTGFAKEMDTFIILAPIVKIVLQVIPYFITCLIFTGLYMFMPNTHVKFKHALFSGIIVGITYQFFQYWYINGQMSVSRYNAIYGSFAAIPLFLLFLQFSWTICLVGTQLTYAGQNIRNFNFSNDTDTISRRYEDFVCILIMSVICKRFEKGETPYTSEILSTAYKIPIRLTQNMLYKLVEVGLLHEASDDTKSNIPTYQPSIDINKMTVNYILDKIDTYGSENFKIEKSKEYKALWDTMIERQKNLNQHYNQMLVKDL
ncbi:MAG: YihY/virulence factor BrkB family protein [Bacteroidaceae bacterium]|nr:YihY/virulence factor BrkB family protein [Bacteroidaceae bacterium]